MNKKPKKFTKATDFDEDLKESLKNPEFKRHFDMYGRQLETAYAILLLRKKAGLSQLALAKKLNMTQSNIARIESGSENVSLTTLGKIAETFNKKLEIRFV